MWLGILAVIFYYLGYLIIFFLEGTTYKRIFGIEVAYYGNLAIFCFLPLSLFLSICAVLNGLFRFKTDKGITPRINLTYGLVTVCLVFLSVFLFLLDLFSFGGPCIFFGITYLIFLTFVAIFLIYLFYRYKKGLSHRKV